jgi:nitrogen regulatory protein PII
MRGCVSWLPDTFSRVDGIQRKLAQCIVRPSKVEDIIDALGRQNVAGLTVTETRGHGKQKGRTAQTGEVGDGRVSVVPVDETYRIRTVSAMCSD